jgi:predicted flap endonuclease-1-like 5' DNA nuclease
MAYQIEQVEGIGPSYAERLAAAEIKTTDDLLGRCAGASGRKDVSARTGVTESQLLKWVNLADLMRISGVGSEYSELLEAAGVDTVRELRNRNPTNLAVRMKEVNLEKKLARSSPSVKTVEKWVTQAAGLDSVVSH